VSLSQFVNSQVVGTYFANMPPPRGWISRQFTSFMCDHCRSKFLKTTNTERKKKHLVKCTPFAQHVRGLLDDENRVILRQIPADLSKEVAKKLRRMRDLQRLLPEGFPLSSDSISFDAIHNRCQSTEDIPALDRSASGPTDIHSPSSGRLSDNDDIRFGLRVDAPRTWNHSITGVSTELEVPVLNQDPWCETGSSPRNARR